MFDARRAEMAQEAYCEQHEVPVFAPMGGRCTKCGMNIYMPLAARNGYSGYSVERAGAEHITGCPHCHKTFCD